MDFLGRDGSPISSELWKKIDDTVIEHARRHLVCRRFLEIYGPLGKGTNAIAISSANISEEFNNGVMHTQGRKMQELPMLYEDFNLLWRDLEESERLGLPFDLSSVKNAVQKFSKIEDNFILFGNKKLGIAGIFNSQNVKTVARSDWSKDENAYKDVASGISYLSSNGMLGRYALLVSPEIYLHFQRLQVNVGLLELDRIAKLVNNHIYPVGTLGEGKAALVCAESQYIDIAIGSDINVGYLEQKDFNHYFRILETLALRIKEPSAIVCFTA